MFDEIWSYIYLNYYPTISSPFFHPVFIFLIYIFTSLPFLICDYFQLFKSYKIHPQKYVNSSTLLRAFIEYIFAEVVVYIPSTMIGYYAGNSIKIQAQAPTLWEMVRDLTVIFMASDISFWFMHRFMHTKFMYKHVHSVHHKYRIPFSFCTQSHHWVESILMSLPVVIPIFYLGTHWLTQMIGFVIILTYGVEGHCGYDFGLQKLTGGIGGFAPMHDTHHNLVQCNYGAYTTIMDRLMGTYQPLN